MEIKELKVISVIIVERRKVNDMSKKRIQSLIIIGIILVLFNVISFAIPFAKNVVFALSYIFSTIAILLQVYVLYNSFSNGKELKSKLYGFPIAKIGVMYLSVQIIVSIIAMALSKFIPIWVVVIIYSLVLGLYAIGFIAADAMREEIVRQDEKLKKVVLNMRELQSKSKFLAKQCENTVAFKPLEDMAEKFRYSDPVSCEQALELENELKMYLEEIQISINETEYQCVMDFCKKIEIILEERNRLCKLNK